MKTVLAALGLVLALTSVSFAQYDEYYDNRGEYGDRYDRRDDRYNDRYDRRDDRYGRRHRRPRPPQPVMKIQCMITAENGLRMYGFAEFTYGDAVYSAKENCAANARANGLSAAKCRDAGGAGPRGYTLYCGETIGYR